MSITALAKTTVQHERGTTTRDATGGQIITWAAMGNLRGSVQPLSGSERVEAGRTGAFITHKVYFPGTPDIQSIDRLVVPGLGAGRSLYVQFPRVPVLDGRLTTVECEERDDG